MARFEKVDKPEAQQPTKAGPSLLLHSMRAAWPKLPAPRLAEAHDALESAMIEFDILTPDRQAAFLANVTVQTQSLGRTTDDGTLAMLQKRYEGRKDLGNVSRGDGVRFRGRGLLLWLIGRGAYRSAGKALGLPLEEQPELVDSLPVQARVAAWQWSTRGIGSETLNTIADKHEFLRIAQILGCAPEYHKRATAWKEWRALLGLEAKAA